MKTIVLLTLLLASATIANAQIMVDGKDVNKTDTEYCKLVVFPSKGGVTATVDYGQAKQKFADRKIREEGEIKVFNSQIDIFNFLHKQGWKYHSSSGVPPSTVSHVFKRSDDNE